MDAVEESVSTGSQHMLQKLAESFSATNSTIEVGSCVSECRLVLVQAHGNHTTDFVCFCSTLRLFDKHV